jgi:hypothetical protein
LVSARSKLKTTMARVVLHHDHLMGEEVASSTPHASRRPPSRVAARVAPRRAAEHASMALSQPAPKGPLAAARELLRNHRMRQPRSTCYGNGVTTSTASSTWHRSPRLSGGICVQGASLSGRRIRFCALPISKECTDRRPAGRAQPQTCGGGCPHLHRVGARAPAQH